MYGKGQRCLNTLPCPFHAVGDHSIVTAPCYFPSYRELATLDFSMLAFTIGAVPKSLAASPPLALEATVVADPDPHPARQGAGLWNELQPLRRGCGEVKQSFFRRPAILIFFPTLAVPGVGTPTHIFHRAPCMMASRAGLADPIRIAGGHRVTWVAVSVAAATLEMDRAPCTDSRSAESTR